MSLGKRLLVIVAVTAVLVLGTAAAMLACTYSNPCY